MSGRAHDPALLEHVARKAAFAFAMPNALPEWLEVLALGRDMMPLGEIVAPAVLDALVELGWQPPTTSRAPLNWDDVSGCCGHRVDDHGADGCLHGWRYEGIVLETDGCLCVMRGTGAAGIKVGEVTP